MTGGERAWRPRRTSPAAATLGRMRETIANPLGRDTGDTDAEELLAELVDHLERLSVEGELAGLKPVDGLRCNRSSTPVAAVARVEKAPRGVPRRAYNLRTPQDGVDGSYKPGIVVVLTRPILFHKGLRVPA